MKDNIMNLKLSEKERMEKDKRLQEKYPRYKEMVDQMLKITHKDKLLLIELSRICGDECKTRINSYSKQRCW